MHNVNLHHKQVTHWQT